MKVKDALVILQKADPEAEFVVNKNTYGSSEATGLYYTGQKYVEVKEVNDLETQVVIEFEQDF